MFTLIKKLQSFQQGKVNYMAVDLMKHYTVTGAHDVSLNMSMHDHLCCIDQKSNSYILERRGFGEIQEIFSNFLLV